MRQARGYPKHRPLFGPRLKQRLRGAWRCGARLRGLVRRERLQRLILLGGVVGLAPEVAAAGDEVIVAPDWPPPMKGQAPAYWETYTFRSAAAIEKSFRRHLLIIAQPVRVVLSECTPGERRRDGFAPTRTYRCELAKEGRIGIAALDDGDTPPTWATSHATRVACLITDRATRTRPWALCATPEALAARTALRFDKQAHRHLQDLITGVMELFTSSRPMEDLRRRQVVAFLEAMQP